MKIAPVVKWAGGKRQLLPHIEPMIPNYKTYYEPFLGGGALFCNVTPKKAVINDFNAQLISMYKQIKNSPEMVCDELMTIQSNYNAKRTMDEKDALYYDLREEYNCRIIEKRKNVAALLIFLNKAGFNGLYRVNASGRYNVPPAHRKQVNAFEKENIMALSKALQKARIMCVDFEEACKDASEGDFVFFDSPYYDTFDTYQAGGFAELDHIRLRDLFKLLSDRGVYCMLTNNACDRIKELYDGFNILEINVKRMINCDGSNRTGKEVIITNY